LTPSINAVNFFFTLTLTPSFLKSLTLDGDAVKFC